MNDFNKSTTDFFYNTLNEEMGIIRNVQHDANIIGLKIRAEIDKAKKLPSDMKMTTFKRGAFLQSVTVSTDNNQYQTKKEIKVVWQYFGFHDKSTYFTYASRIEKTRYDEKLNILYVSVVSISGIIDSETLEGHLAHELTHSFQSINRNRPILSNGNIMKSYKNSDKNINQEHGIYKYIGIVVYLSYNFEQDAYLNAACNYIVRECNNGNSFLYVYSQTEAYHSLHKMRNHLDILKEILKNNNINGELETHCKNEYNVSLEKIYAYGERTYKRYAKKLARMYNQAINDVEEKQKNEGVMFHTREFYNPFKNI